MEERSKSQLNQIKQNNEQINNFIEQILKIRREQRFSIEENGIIDLKIKKLLQNEVNKCLEIYKIEFPDYTCQGKETISFRQPKKTADCYGGTEGLQITYGMQNFIDEKILPIMSKMGYKIDENDEITFDETLQTNTEHDFRSDVNAFKKYVGSTKDQMDYFALLYARNGVDLDFIWDALAHEEMHTFGVSNGNTFLKEGTTEELTREICEKYNIHMSPHAHTQEANFVRKLEMLVGRDIVIESGMWTGKFKEQEFSSLLEKDSKLTYSELSETFELLKSEPQKLLEEEKKVLNEFCISNPNVAEKLKRSVEKYRLAEAKNQRYEGIAQKFDSELGIKSESFYKYIEILENMYNLSQNYKTDPKIYRDIYNLPFEELESGYIVFQTKEELKQKDIEILSKIKTLCNELSKMNPSMKINSFYDLIAPIDEKIKDRELLTKVENKDYSKVLAIQEKESRDLMEICSDYGIYIEHKNKVKGITLQEIGKETTKSFCKNFERANKAINTLESEVKTPKEKEEYTQEEG